MEPRNSRNRGSNNISQNSSMEHLQGIRNNRAQSNETRRCETQKSSGLMQKINNTHKQIRDSSEGGRSEIL